MHPFVDLRDTSKDGGVRVEMTVDCFHSYEEAVVAYIDDHGYPMNVPVSIDIEGDRLRIGTDWELPPGTRVVVTASHIRPQPGTGYDQRRYVNAWGIYDSGEIAVERITGWDETEVPFFEYCERSVVQANAYLKKLSEERGYEVLPRLAPGWRFFLATRIPFLTATVIPVGLGAVIARYDGFSAWWYILLAFLGASAVHLGLNVFNDIYDEDADSANSTPTPFSGGSRLLQYGLISKNQMLALARILFGVGILIGLVLSATRGWSLLLVGIPGILLAYFYTAPPIRLAYRGLGDIAVAVGFGPVTVLGTYFVASHRFSWQALVASIPIAIFAMLILYVNQIPDRLGDAAASKKTLAVRLSKQATLTGYAIFALAGFFIIALGVSTEMMPIPSLIAILPAPLAIYIWHQLDKNYDQPFTLIRAMGLNIALHAVVGTLVIVGYLLAI